MDIYDNIYKINEFDNGDILLEKLELDNSKYTIIKKDNGDVLLKKIATVYINNFEDIAKYNFTFSKILYCKLNNNELSKLKYSSIICSIYNIIDDGAKIIKNTNLNIKTKKYIEKGFYYLENIGISFQKVDSNNSLLEIINQSIKNNITISLKIKMETGIILNIKFI